MHPLRPKRASTRQPGTRARRHAADGMLHFKRGIGCATYLQSPCSPWAAHCPEVSDPATTVVVSTAPARATSRAASSRAAARPRMTLTHGGRGRRRASLASVQRPLTARPRWAPCGPASVSSATGAARAEEGRQGGPGGRQWRSDASPRHARRGGLLPLARVGAGARTGERELGGLLVRGPPRTCRLPPGTCQGTECLSSYPGTCPGLVHLP